MAYPATVPPIKFYAGDPLTIAFYFTGVDLTSKVFQSQIRAHDTDTASVDFDVEVYLDSAGTTWVVLQADGDSAAGEEDGITRQIPLTAVYDVQVIEGGVTLTTMFRGTLEGTWDVTR